MIKVAIMGYGTIGSGVCEVLEENQKQIADYVGQEIQVKINKEKQIQIKLILQVISPPCLSHSDNRAYYIQRHLQILSK